MNHLIETEEFFAPVSADLVDNLIGRYRQMKLNIESVFEFINNGSNAKAISYFLHGNRESERYIRKVNDIFKQEGAIARLNADYWQMAMRLTDVYEYMPASRRSEWDKQIEEMKTPDFEEDTVRSTLTDLLNSRQQFFGERVDGIFHALSGEHVTNQPQGFGKRMIIWVEYRKEHITDLRQVVAKFMGREDEPNWQSTEQLLKAADRQSVQWMNIDGGSMRIRTYKKGTAHFEVHPDMAWRLNGVLASMYPAAIPAEFRQKPKKKLKDFVMMQRPLPFVALRALGEMKRVRTTTYRGYHNELVEPKTTNSNSFEFHYSVDKQVNAEVGRILEAIGAVRFTRGAYEELPSVYDDAWNDQRMGFNIGIELCRETIEAQGLTVK
ncbi:DUF4942 domain-containing protein [Pragia fontium]|uniref:DUF4942 domain-containing protein n=1 Tax=Pragia fontium TaxID=82985 RepID=UPI000F6CEBD0|nr:DUF4942 domain-containing protein [Pragia fontium]VEJ54584.1 Uncharacterised protein [Pragia fontium]